MNINQNRFLKMTKLTKIQISLILKVIISIVLIIFKAEENPDALMLMISMILISNFQRKISILGKRSFFIIEKVQITKYKVK